METAAQGSQGHLQVRETQVGLGFYNLKRGRSTVRLLHTNWPIMEMHRLVYEKAALSTP
jgi:hypothetical protein